MRLALLDDYQGVALQMADWHTLAGVEVVPIGEHIADPAELVRRLQPFEAVMLMRERTKFPRAVIEALPNLRLIVTAAMWNVAIDVEAATDRGIQVAGTGDWGFATAELAVGLMIALSRHMVREDRALRQGRWQTTLGSGLHGKTLGLLGVGQLGGRVARLGTALGMTCIGWSQNLTAEAAAGHGVTRVDKDELLRRADIVSIHLRLSERTRGLIGARELGLMQPSALLINTSRGPIVEQAALVAHLQQGRIAGAGIDVYDEEPVAPDHPLLALDNVVVLPHLGYVVEQNYRLIYGDALEDVRAFMRGEVLRPLNTLATAGGGAVRGVSG
jgi:phosphoglycerate dehydrogenase-like enzyme